MVRCCTRSRERANHIFIFDEIHFMSNQLTFLLGLPNVSVNGISSLKGDGCLHLLLTNVGINCPHCQQYITEMHQNRPITVRDLPCFGKITFLLVPRRQFYCPHCQRYSTERLDWLDWQRRHTQRYETQIFARVLSSSIAQVAVEEDLSFDEVEGIFNHLGRQQVKNNWSMPKRISIDEIAMHKGHQDYKTVVCDIDSRQLIEVIDGRTQESILQKLMEQPLEIREAVEEVSVDMWGGFPKIVAEIFPNATLVIDRFHVMQPLIEELKKIFRQVKVTQIKKISLGLRNKASLNSAELQELEQLLERSNRLRQAYEYKEDFRQIYETSQSVEEGREYLLQWLKKAANVYGKVIRTIDNHSESICNYFINRTTNGVMEGINNKIKLIKRQAYGFRNFDSFRLRLLAAFIK